MDTRGAVSNLCGFCGQSHENYIEPTYVHINILVHRGNEAVEQREQDDATTMEIRSPPLAGAPPLAMPSAPHILQPSASNPKFVFSLTTFLTSLRFMPLAIRENFALWDSYGLHGVHVVHLKDVS